MDEATASFEQFDYARAMERTESFFWPFCDDYLELVKNRAYGTAGDPDRDSVLVTLRIALETLLKLFAPFLPYVTEEVWSWWKTGSIHRSAWPEAAPVRTAAGPETPDGLLETAGEVLSLIRKAKTNAQVSMRAPVATCRDHGRPRQVGPDRDGGRRHSQCRSCRVPPGTLRRR